MPQVTAPDGTDVITVEQGSGPVVLVLHGGLSDESAWAPPAAALATEFRVVRVRRRLYRLDLAADPATDFANEVADVLAVAAAIGEPVVLVGHSSGAVVALETLAADPGAFAGAVLYEPPLVLDAPIGGADGLARARAALDRGRPGRALAIFLHRMVALPLPVAAAAGVAGRLAPGLRRYVARQIDDTEAINRLGPRLRAYAGIDVPVLLVTGERSPLHLRLRSEALAAILPRPAGLQTMPGQGHGANHGAPEDLAARIATFARQVLGPVG